MEEDKMTVEANLSGGQVTLEADPKPGPSSAAPNDCRFLTMDLLQEAKKDYFLRLNKNLEKVTEKDKQTNDSVKENAKGNKDSEETAEDADSSREAVEQESASAPKSSEDEGKSSGESPKVVVGGNRSYTPSFLSEESEEELDYGDGDDI